MKRILFIGVMVIGLGLSKVLAQPDPPPDPSDVPVDGGLSFLIASGIGYGIYRIKKAKVDNQDI